MSTHALNLDEARKKRPSTVMLDEEKCEILDYLHKHEDDEDAISYLMEKHNCSNTTIGIIVMNDQMTRNREKHEKERAQ